MTSQLIANTVWVVYLCKHAAAALKLYSVDGECTMYSPCSLRVGAKPGLWTLDWTHGLDSWTGLWTDIWTEFWTDTAMGDDHFQPLTRPVSAEAKPKSVMSVAETNLELGRNL